ncbi:dethiobiotin synthase [Candidatus Methylopumilus turicensis]|uniref:ATP-dependent dethiobiotin synthetase BioD n=1 Tax=Candidatus Methylopumilus turicensis TaxID=1581680 RepID=A0A0B7ISX5_9PROT|nr:dethiobiotin synthase [Candidatus Methylopumilus turicensis]CEN55444.1 dethiobiotin synthetase [Candidatus Methylopumilus turicensis]
MQKNKTAYFITGTDTDVGKTYVAAALVRHFVHQGLQAVGMKPVAAGAEMVNGRLLNSDVTALIKASNVDADLALMNPYVFAPAIAPHIAAEQVSMTVSLDDIQQAFDALQAKADVVVVEGAGGFRVPINRQETMADLAVKLNLPVIMVVGVRLGCINHALMTAGSIGAAGLNLVGWVANRLDPNMPAIEENIATLKAMIKAPCIADVAWGEEPQFIDF